MTQIFRNNYPVHAEFDGHDFVSNGVSFDDYTRMHVQEQRKPGGGRVKPAPDWAFNDAKLRAVIVALVEARAYQTFKKNADRSGTDAERLARAQRHLTERIRPKLLETVNRLCKRYVEATNAGADAATMRELGRKVQECDTQICTVDNAALFYTGVAYWYWRHGADSVETAERMHIKPPLVRQIIHRLEKLAGELGFGPRMIEKHGPVVQARRAASAAAKAKRTAVKQRRGEDNLLRKTKSAEYRTVCRFAAYLAQGLTWPKAKGMMRAQRTTNYFWRALCSKHGIELPKRHGSSRVGFLSAEQTQQAAAMRAQGMAYKEIGQQFGCGMNGVRNALKRTGQFQISERGAANRDGRGKFVLQEALRLHAQGWKIRRIAEHFDVGIDTVYVRLRKAGCQFARAA